MSQTAAENRQSYPVKNDRKDANGWRILKPSTGTVPDKSICAKLTKAEVPGLQFDERSVRTVHPANFEKE